jgi:hypothetical protein
VKRASYALLFLTVLCVVALSAAAAGTRVRASGVDGVYIEGTVTFTGAPFTAALAGNVQLAPPVGAVGWSATHLPQQGVVVVKLTYRLGPLRVL